MRFHLKRGSSEEEGMQGRIKSVRIGQQLTVYDDPDHGEKKGRRKRIYRVTAIYPHIVLAVDSIGNRRAFTYGHMIQMGLEQQEPMLEAMRR